MAGRADDGQPIPRVGLRFTLRFQAVVAAEDVVSRTWFCRKVIMEQLNLKVDAIYCLQWNQQEKAFDVTLKDEQVEGSSRCFLNLIQRVLAASSTRLPPSALEQIEGTYSTRVSQLSAGDADNQAMWMEGAAAPAAGFVAKEDMRPKTVQCQRPDMAAVGSTIYTEAVPSAGGRLRR
ncbi:hypothetical protein KUCAC02_037743 [Chaenocephalus aceratus]|nr:hypothetical protein KUCAC02_037743 [Chaenocephalus aceratus]